MNQTIVKGIQRLVLIWIGLNKRTAKIGVELNNFRDALRVITLRYSKPLGEVL